MSGIANLKKVKIMPENQPWFNNCHSSSLIKLGGNNYLCAYMAGEREGQPDMSIWLSHCRDGKWENPVKIKGEYGLPHWNPILHLDRDIIYLIYKVGPTVPCWYTMVSVSADFGETWGPSYEAVKDDRSPRITAKNKILVASDNRWLGPCSIEKEITFDCYVDISVDKGKTWEKHTIPIDHEVKEHVTVGGWDGLNDLWENDVAVIQKWDGVIQPTLWESSPGVFHAFMRSTHGYIYRSDSTDNGETWCKAYPTDLPNNNSGIDLVRLANGTIVLVYNPVSGNFSKRYPLSMALSKDNGKTFTRLLDLEDTEGEFSYPAVIFEENTIFMTYTYNRKTFVFCSLDICDSESGS